MHGGHVYTLEIVNLCKNIDFILSKAGLCKRFHYRTFQNYTWILIMHDQLTSSRVIMKTL